MIGSDSLCEGVRTLFDEAAALAPSVGLGVVRNDGPGHVVLTYVDAFGTTAYRTRERDIPEAVRPRATGLLQLTDVELQANPGGLAESRWLHTTFPDEIRQQFAVRRVVTLPIPDGAESARLVVGLAERGSPSDAQLSGLESLAAGAVDFLKPIESSIDEIELLRRINAVEQLLPALFRVLEIREIFESLSAVTKDMLRHDFATLGVLNEDLTHIEVHAQTSSRGPSYTQGGPMPFPPVQTAAWLYRFIDDLQTHPLERRFESAKAGGHSSLRVAIRLEETVIGALNFTSCDPAPYTAADLVVARRIADYVALALSHQRLAEESRRTAALRERAANLETLEGLLTTLTGVLDIRDVFDRVSAIAQQVLSHDGLALAELLENDQVRVHACQGFGALPVPFDAPRGDNRQMPERGDFKLVDDLSLPPHGRDTRVSDAGMRSMLVVPIHVEGRQYGGLTFYSKTVGHFTRDDVLAAQRIADHVALAISHQRLAEHARHNEELRARAANLELVDALLAASIDSDELPDIFGRISTIATKVLPHDAVALMVRLPDGQRVRVYASSGFPTALPQTMDIPPELLDNSAWEADIVDAFPVDGSRFALAASLGFRSALRVCVRLDGQFAGALVFFSTAPSRFAQGDVQAASRIADRMAIALARDREVAASKRADEASARAARLESRVRALTEELDARTGYRRVVGESPEWRSVLTQATQVAPNETTVLLLGESGTGKEVVARFVHRASPRHIGPFIALNCAALPDQLLEAELFGYERGAYTGAVQSKPGQLEQAAGGTLFLDEVGEMSLPAQAKFLRVLQEREFQRLGGTRVLRTDARIIAATNRDLEQAIALNQFREDLYYRLNVFAIYLPALRDRSRDILPLSEAFLVEIGRSIARPAAGISRDARERLLDYDWPGNVRELRNILERASILCDGGLITPDHLAIGLGARLAPPARLKDTRAAPRPRETAAPRTVAPLSPAGDLKSMERDMIEEALQRVRFNKSKAAKHLGLTRQQLYLRMKKYGLE